MAVLEITQENFKEKVLQEEKIVLLDFWDPWCENCKAMEPILEEISKEREDVKVYRIDIEKNPNFSASFRIKNLPTIVVMRDGSVVNYIIGLQPKSTLISMLAQTIRK